MDPWEDSLDLDDSDLSASLRRCKQRRVNPPSPSKTITITTTILTPSLPFPDAELPSPHSHSQTLDFHSPPSTVFSNTTTTTTSHRFIPGPAGILQAAMYRKEQDRKNGFVDGDPNPIPTQEYIRRAVEDGGGIDDEDFLRDPWLCAVDFVRSEGMVDGVAIGTPISSINSCSNPSRVAQVVAVIKSCTPNGLSDLMATLKDPTGTIGACIHRKVLAKGESGRGICVGSVLILQKVAVFSPSRTVHYLNITCSNVVKVFSKDASLLKQKHSASTFEHDTPECSGQASMLWKEFSPFEGGTGVRDNARQNDDEATGGSSRSNRSSRNKNAAVDMTRGTTKAADNANSVNNEQMDVGGSGKQAEGVNLSGDAYCNISASANLVRPATNDGEAGNGNEAEKTRQPPCSRGPIPQWTDEQLDALCAFDCDNDDLF